MSRFQHKTETARLLPRKLPPGTILNRAGQPVKALTAPAGGSALDSRLDRLNAWIEGYNPLRGLTIARAVQLLEDFEIGRMTLVQWAFYFAERTDADSIGLIELRLGRLLEMDYNVQTEEDADERLATQQQELLQAKLAAIDNLYDAIEHLALATFRGYAHVEKYFDRAGEIFHLEPVDQWNVVRDGMRGAWRYNPKAVQCDFASLPAEADMPLDRFLYREVKRPINRFALLKFVRQNLSEKDWDAFNEIYNVPGGVVIGPPEVPEGEEDVYAAAARKISEGGSGYLPNGSDYKPNEMPHQPDTFERRLKYLSEKHVLAGTGGKLTMLTDATGLGSGASEAHDRVFQSIAAADARRISEIINKQLVKPWLDAAFPGQEQVAYFALAANEETDSGKAVDQVNKLSLAGYQVDPEQVQAKTGWQVTLKPMPAVQIGGGAGPDGRPLPPITNRSSIAAGNEARFLANADRTLSAAEQLVMKPLLDRVVALDTITDDAEWLAAARRLQAELPDLEAKILAGHPELDAAFAAVTGTAMLSGMVEAAAPTGLRPDAAPEKALNARRGIKTRTRSPKRPK